MIVRKRYNFAIIAVLLAVGLILTIAWANLKSATTAPINTYGRAGGIPTPIVVNSLAYAQGSVKIPLVLPSAASIMSAFGSSYTIHGVVINYRPHLQTFPSYDGKTNHTIVVWSVGLVLWDKSVVNGTTTNQDIYTNGGVIVTEWPAPPGVNSTRSANDFLAPPVVCKTYTGTTTDVTSQTSCSTATQTGDTYVTKINGLAVIVAPSGGTVRWLDDRNLRWYDIHSESIGIAKLLQLATAIITG